MEIIYLMIRRIWLWMSVGLIISSIILVLYINKCIQNGEKYMKNGQYEMAINSFKKLLNLGQALGYTDDTHFYPSLYFFIGYCYLELGNYNKAKENFKRAMELASGRQSERNTYILKMTKKFLKKLNSSSDLNK